MAYQKVIGIAEKLAAFLLFSFSMQSSNAETILVPLSKFDNDSQQLTNSRVLEFWGYHAADGGDNYQNTLRLRYYNPLKAGDWHGRIRLDTAYVANYNYATSPNNSGH